MKKSIGKTLMNVLVFTSVFGMLTLLSMINVKLLSRLNWIHSSIPIIDDIIMVIAGISFALGSISIILWYNTNWKKEALDTTKMSRKRLTGNTILKLTFVLLDGFHVFIYNNDHIEELALWVSPLFAIQTTLILFFIGNVVEDLINKTQEE